MTNKPNVLLLDIETAPMLAYVWGLWGNDHISLDQVKSDWYILAYSAKWLGDPVSKIIYKDQRNVKNIEDDKALMESIWKLLDKADIIITQNGKHFDQKKLNARFILNKMQPPSSFRHIDTVQIAKRHFGFTSNKLAYMSDKINKKYKKLTHAKFPGFELWKECLKGNIEAWREMEVYNKHDVLALEELYNELIPWDNTINFNVYDDEVTNECKCRKPEIIKRGYFYTEYGKYQRYKCVTCGTETRSKGNLLSKEKQNSLRLRTVR